jgi:hypothetical protein
MAKTAADRQRFHSPADVVSSKRVVAELRAPRAGSERQQCEAATEEKLTAKLEKVKIHLNTTAARIGVHGNR